jgi:hypothetical protein
LIQAGLPQGHQEAGYPYKQSRTWCPIGAAILKRKGGPVRVTDPDAESKKVE